MRLSRAISCLVVCIGLAGGVLPSLVDARSLTDTLRRTGLTQGDITVMSEAAGVLYRQGSPRIGESVDWTNPETGAAGTSTLQGFQDECATLRHVVTTARRPQPQDFLFRQCRSADGGWVLTP